jgi:hypothetical protein
VEGWYYLSGFDVDHLQEPFDSPGVFNFYLPTYSPPGVLAQGGLAAPEMQIVNASSGVTAPNYFWDAVTGQVGETARPERQVKLNLDQEMLMNIPSLDFDEDGQTTVTPLDPDPLIRRLDLALTGGTLEPESFQIIREALGRVSSGEDWHENRLKLAIYLIVCSPEFAVQH